jgi:hypothetical protein
MPDYYCQQLFSFASSSPVSEPGQQRQRTVVMWQRPASTQNDFYIRRVPSSRIGNLDRAPANGGIARLRSSA